jgi:hypothetical protein
MDYLTVSFVKAAFVKELNFAVKTSKNQARRLAVNLVEEDLGRHLHP